MRITKDLFSWLTLGERIQQAFQRHAETRNPQCRMVLNHKAGQDRHRKVAQTVQPCQASSGSQHEATRARNSTNKWPITMGLYIRESLREYPPIPPIPPGAADLYTIRYKTNNS